MSKVPLYTIIPRLLPARCLASFPRPTPEKESPQSFKVSPLCSAAVEVLLVDNPGEAEGSYLRLIDFCITQL